MGPRGLLVVVAAALAATDVAAVEPGCPASNVGINVIRAADGSRTEVVGELPELPHGTRELSYGPTAFCNDFDGIIVVGGPVVVPRAQPRALGLVEDARRPAEDLDQVEVARSCRSARHL